MNDYERGFRDGEQSMFDKIIALRSRASRVVIETGDVPVVKLKAICQRIEALPVPLPGEESKG